MNLPEADKENDILVWYFDIFEVKSVIFLISNFWYLIA